MPKHGDTRKDGYRFWGMCDGREDWLSPKAWEVSRALNVKLGKARAEKCRQWLSTVSDS
jgi:hypothetical protein